MTRRQYGSALGEQLIMLAMVALFIAVAAAAFSYSPVYGFIMIGAALGAGLLIFTFGVLRDRRMERLRVARCRLELERVAAAQETALESTFFGEAQGGPAAFGVAGAARKLIYARHDFQRVFSDVLEFDQLSAAFARPDGEGRFRLEVRARANADRSPREPLFLTVAGREEAERWVQVLAPHLGARAKMVALDSKGAQPET